MKQPLVFSVVEGENGARLDVFLVGRLGINYSREGIKRWIKEGFVGRQRIAHGMVEGGVGDGLGTLAPNLERNPAKKVLAGEIWVVDVPAVEAATLVGEDIPLEVVYEDDDLLVINKPAGLTVHPAPGNYTGTLVQALIWHCGASLSGMNGEARPGIVHRIDKDTSGLLVVAKHDVAHRGLAKQFMRHSIHRVYLALVRGVPLPAAGVIRGNIGRHPTQRVRRAVVEVGGKVAVTHYRTREVFGAEFGGAAALVECQLETGRTHQIRVHLAHVGHPLLGDPLYGGALGGRGALKGLGEIELPRRQLLHAAELGFIHPMTGQEMRFESALPADMELVLGWLREA